MSTPQRKLANALSSYAMNCDNIGKQEKKLVQLEAAVLHAKAEHLKELCVLKKLKLQEENCVDLIALYHTTKVATKESAMAPGFHPEPRHADDMLKLTTPVVKRKTTPGENPFCKSPLGPYAAKVPKKMTADVIEKEIAAANEA